MNKEFQERIDEYLLHADTMSEEEKVRFEKEIEKDAGKKEQLEFTKSVMEAVVSRGEKMKALGKFQKALEKRECQQAEPCSESAEMLPEEHVEKKAGHGKTLLWVAGVAAVIVAGFFIFEMLPTEDSSNGTMRGGDDVFDVSMPADSVEDDSVRTDTATSLNE